MKKNNSLKILLISSFYPTETEPTEFPSIIEQAQSLSVAGHEVTVLFFQGLTLKNVFRHKKGELRNDHSSKSGVLEIESYYVKSHLKRINEYILYFNGKQILDEWVKRSGIPDIVHVHSYRVGELSLWFHNKYHVPLITSEYSDCFKSGYIEPREEKRASRLYRFSSANLTASSQFADTLKHYTGVPFSVLPIFSDDIQKSDISNLEEIYQSITSSPDILQASSTISQQGGICKVAYQMGYLLSQYQHRVTTFTSELDPEADVESLGRIIILKQPEWVQNLPAYLRNYFKSFYFTRDVHSIFKDKNKNPNCVTISHRDTYGADIAVGHSCHKESVKIKKNKRNPFWILNPIHHLYLKQEKAICKHPETKLIAISTSIAEEYIKNYGIASDFVEVIPNGVDLLQFNPSNKSGHRNSILQELQLPREVFLLLFVGNEFKRKGLEFIIEALHHIDDESLHLLVLGHADKSAFQKRTFQLGLSQNVHFLGRRSDAANFFSGSDLFIIPADYEPFGLVGIEAMSCGTPILATKLGGFLDYLRDGINGYFISRDSNDIADKIRMIKARDLKQIDEMSINARKTAEQYSWEGVGLHYSQIIEKTIKHKRQLKLHTSFN